MVHSTTTAPAIVAVGPSGPGALAGFQVNCPCGFTFRTSLRTMAANDAREHVAYMARKGR